MRTIILFASPCGGKDTQADLLVAFLKGKSIPYLYVSTGSYFRGIKKPNHTLKLIEEVMGKGELLPDFLAEGVVISSLLLNDLDPEKFLIFNGFPRNLDQAKKLLKILEFYGRIKPEVLFIEVSPETAIERMKMRIKGGENRADDNAESIHRRFEIFYKENASLIEFLCSAEFKFHRIDGSGTIEGISKKIFEALAL